MESNLITYKGTILFNPEDKTRKHENQSSWKRTAMVIIPGEICDYYAWFIKKRFNLELNKPIRGAHISFINDHIRDINGGLGTIEERQEAWEKLSQKWNGKEIEVTLDLRVKADNKKFLHWWMIVPHDLRGDLQSIRSEIGLDKPFYGMHMTIGYDNERNFEHSKYIIDLIEKEFIKI